MNRGRGRGRGSAGPRPVARDDDGDVLPVQPAEGPPPLFPPKQLPPLPSAAELDQMAPLVSALSSMTGYFQKSPFNLGGTAPGKRKADAMQALAAVVPLDPTYIPAELTQKSKARSAATQAAYWAAQREQRARRESGAKELSKIEELARREKESQREEEAGAPARAEGGAPPEEGEAEEGDEEELGPEEEAGGDEEYDLDDAYQEAYEQYDDDEGYDLDDEGGNEGTY